MLDIYSSLELIKRKHRGWVDKCLSNPNLSDKEKVEIAFYGSNKQKHKLIDEYELSSIARRWIALAGNDEHRDKLRKLGDIC